MSSATPNPSDLKMLPASGSSPGAAPGAAAPPQAIATTPPPRQMSELPKDELEHLAEEYGLDPTQYKTRQHLVAAIHERRQLIASFDRDAMLDVIRWGRRPVAINASKDQLAIEISRVRLMKFNGLSQRGLCVLARLRGMQIKGDEPIPVLVRKLKRQEGIFSKLNRKRRAFIGSIVSNMLGESEPSQNYEFLPTDSAAPGASQASRSATIKDEIEESGLFGGLTKSIKKSADSYLNQKLDEIEARIDRKLDEIDRRLAEWRDKEIANRIRILKITLWASVIVGAFSLIYSYVQVYLVPSSKENPPAHVSRR
ncbi:MAG TPA: hypothetical protein VL282_13155 [Tepidisphaeraceae bacterium]|jgi:hypothetical protein|nr:hypothetical protein [Tepidisphaeraceae bacterium]